MLEVNFDKNRKRDDYSFANINLLGSCNVNCFFCLGKDIEEYLTDQNQLRILYHDWKNFYRFLELCTMRGIKKIYITGQNTDSLMYKYLNDLIDFLHEKGFQVGLRTNGYLALKKMEEINKCELSVGYSIHSINPVTNNMILGRSDMPDWDTIIPATNTPRVQIVLNRCNKFEFWDVLRYISKFKGHVRYVQIRRPSTDTRQDLLAADVRAYEEIYTEVSQIFPMTRKFVTDAEEYEIYGLPVVFWRTVKTSVN